MSIPKITALFDLSHTSARPWLEKAEYGHEVLEQIPQIIRELQSTLGDDYEQLRPQIFVAKDATISPLATIEAPTIIGHRTEVRPGAYIRGSALIGDDCVIGNSTEIKNAILFDHVQVPHYNYVGDSILGYRAHMGAGAIASNFRADHGEVMLRCEGAEIFTGRRKVGAMVGDLAEVGCGSVLCPGAIVGRESVVYPLSRVRGVVKERMIFKSQDEIVDKK